MKQSLLMEQLHQIYLFAQLEESALRELADVCRVKKYQKGELLFMQGEFGEDLLILIEGVVSVYKHDDKGNEITINHFKPVSMIAEPAILQSLPYPSSAVFKTDGTIVKIEREFFKSRFLYRGDIALNIINSLLEKIQLLQNTIAINISGSAKERILFYYQNSPSRNLELKQYEIATLLGMSPETLSRNLKKLEAEKLLIKKGAHYEVVAQKS